MLVTPFIGCAARIPVYTIIIGLVIPPQRLWGIFQYQGLVLMGLYLLGVCCTLGSAWVLHTYVFPNTEKHCFIMELPAYQWPSWKEVAQTVYVKCASFVIDAGKVILIISLLIWVLTNYRSAQMAYQIDQEMAAFQQTNPSSEQEEAQLQALKTQHSYAGALGRWIEPAIRPLGYDWKIGIALISSFAAREVFVSTISTIYSVHDTREQNIREKLRLVKNARTGKASFTLATGISLLVFYALAMQCMSTIAVTYRETGKWQYAMLQLVSMNGIAYLAAFLAYQCIGG